MKTPLIIMLALAVGFSHTACKQGANQAQTDAAQADTAAAGAARQLDVAGSSLKWKGWALAGVKSHEGTVGIKGGSLTVSNGQLADGEFSVDMTTLTATDLQGEDQAKLNRHLKGGFFHVDSLPEAKFEITNVAPLAAGDTAGTHSITGNLTLHGQTNSITFPAHVNVPASGPVTARAVFTIDRTKWGIRELSKAREHGVKDEIQLSVDLRTQS